MDKNIHDSIIIIIDSFLTGAATATATTISLREIASTIQYGYRKCGTHARVYSQTFGNGNSRRNKTKA